MKKKERGRERISKEILPITHSRQEKNKKMDKAKTGKTKVGKKKEK